jgi:hypothetical protein
MLLFTCNVQHGLSGVKEDGEWGVTVKWFWISFWIVENILS